MHAQQEFTRIGHVLDILKPLISGRKLLDIGCIGHDLDFRRGNGTFYFDRFQKIARYARGIDILDTAVQKARAMGYNVVKGDAETYRDDTGYDVVFAGELVEHLSNPGRFFECCRENLGEDGLVVLTTPNTYSLARLTRVLFRRTNEPPVNPEHTFYYTPLTLGELAGRHGFAVRAIYYSDYDYGAWPFSLKKRIGLRLNSLLCRVFPQFSQSFVMVLERA